MFFFPWGHDRPLYERPWLTISLIAFLVAIHVFVAQREAAAMDDFRGAMGDAATIADLHPGARAHLTIDGLPPSLSRRVQPLIATPADPPTPADATLEEAVSRAMAALNRVPFIAWGYRPAHPSLTRAFTSMFLHADFSHLIGNVMILWIAASLIESFWHRAALAGLYLGAGLFGTLTHTVSFPSSNIPTIGASGAIAGLMGAFAVLYPKVHIKVFYVTLWLGIRYGTVLARAWALLGFWVALELLALVGRSADSVAHDVHVAGFVFGVVAALVAKHLGWVASDAGYSTTLDRLPDQHDGRAPDARSPSTMPPSTMPPGARLPSVRPQAPGVSIPALAASDFPSADARNERPSSTAPPRPSSRPSAADVAPIELAPFDPHRDGFDEFE